MIKSKIDARERALELAVKCFESVENYSGEQVIHFSKLYEQYLIGDADLPEVADDNAHIKELLKIVNKSVDNSQHHYFTIEELRKFLDKRGLEHLEKLKAE